MVRGRKKKENPLNETISIKITEKQKQLLNKNKWMKEEIDRQVRDYINIYMEN